jgi:hypothetical protein
MRLISLQKSGPRGTRAEDQGVCPTTDPLPARGRSNPWGRIAKIIPENGACRSDLTDER